MLLVCHVVLSQMEWPVAVENAVFEVEAGDGESGRELAARVRSKSVAQWQETNCSEYRRRSFCFRGITAVTSAACRQQLLSQRQVQRPSM